MTPTEMEEALSNCTRRLTSIEQILPTLATKQDLEQFATKQDLERFATKQDLARFATKQDLARFATKQDLERVERELAAVRLKGDATFELLSTLIERLERKGVI